MPALVIALLRVVHIVAGVFWVGSGISNAFFLMPSVIAAGSAGGAVMRQLVQVRKLPVATNVAMLLSLLSGLALYGWYGHHGKLEWILSPTGLAYGVSLVLAFASAGVGHGLVSASAKRLAAIASPLAPSGAAPTPEQAAEIAALQARMLTGSRIAATLGLVVVALMSVARYL